jgi:endonuclease/exonuclease/phosphatase (EEP) superfamily protein YafD
MRLSTIFTRLIWGYISLFSLWILVRLVFFDRFWWLALINTVALYIFVPLLLFLPLAFFYRRWRCLLGLCFPLGVFLAFYGPLFFPSLPVALAQDSRQITVMSFNMLFANTDFDEIARMVNANSPDIIGLQEVPENGDKSLLEKFASTYPYHAFLPIENTHNVGILSRFPIQEVTALPKPLERAFQATVLVDGKRHLQVIVSHLIPNYPMSDAVRLAQGWYDIRAAQASYIANLVKQRKVPNLMICDCNFTESSETYMLTRKAMHDSFYDVGWGFGHTMTGPFFPVGRIDYIWYTKELQPIEAYVPSGGGSDHLAVIAKLAIR